jgi:2-furoate---CoA ligase
MQTGYDLVRLAAERTPERAALVDDRTERTLTYRELMREVDVIAAGLSARGVTACCRVATALPNLFEHCLVLLALQRLAAVPALLNFRLPPDQLATLAADGGMFGAVVQNDPAVTEKMAAALPAGGLLLTVGGDTGTFAQCRGDATALPPRPRPDPDDIAYIFYTSGTTGKPKGVLVAHRTTAQRVACLSPLAGLRYGDELRALGASPLFHAIGFYCVFMVTLAYNGTYYAMSAFRPDAAVDLIAKRRITFMFVVPTVLQAIVSAPNYDPARMRSLRLVIHGGAPIAAALLARICDEWTEAAPCHLYGTTETMIPFFNHAPRDNPTQFHVGYDHRARVVAFGGSPSDQVAPGASGEVIIDATTDSIFSGYLGQPEVTAKKIRDGWYYTGDVCVRNADGTFDLVGRIDDAIRSGAETVYPEEVEAVLTEHPGAREACVIGLPDDYWGEIVVACIVESRPGLAWESLDAHCRGSRLAAFKRPRAYIFVKAIPRNAANKILRGLVKDAAVVAVTTSNDIHRVAA